MRVVQTIALLCLAAFYGCKTTAPFESALRDTETPAGPCSAVRATQNMTVNLFANAPLNRADFFAPGGDGGELERVVSLFQGQPCQDEVRRILTTSRPNVYIYFTGYGGPVQPNPIVDEGYVMQWINRRDPTGLIFAVGWDCEGATRAGFDWCARASKAYDSTPDKPEQKFLADSYNALLGVEEAGKFIAQTRAIAEQQQGGYNAALTNSMHNAAALLDHLLHLNIGLIHIAGYSMGAHSASDILIADFTDEEETTGYKWSKPDVCSNGQQVCTIAFLKNLNWSLAMGLSGWADSMQKYNKFSDDGVPSRDRNARRLYENGGLIRIKDRKYNNKLNVFNRRMDPTSNSHDTSQRGINDAIFGDYNHYSHDYNQPPFRQAPFIKTLEEFLAEDRPRDLLEFGIIHDAAAFVDFDDCGTAHENCLPKSNYLAHKTNRRHSDLLITTARYPVKTVVGVTHRDRTNNRAASFVRSQQPLTVNSMDQEDLRGGIEFFFMPRFDPQGAEKHGLFSYGTCTGSSEDLMPQAYFENGKLVFTANYLGQRYTVSVDASHPKIKENKWAHLAFTWDLPTFPISRNPLELSEDGRTLNKDLSSEARQAAMAEDLQTYGQALVVAATLRTASATTYKKQKGKGFLRIYINGEKAGEAALGEDTSERACLNAQDVLGASGQYFVAHDASGGEIMYPPYLPYANYAPQMGDPVSLGPGFEIGKKCKAFRVRNTPIHFGCAGEEGVTAEGYMDDVAVIFGHGREEYTNISPDGRPAKWPINR